LTLLLLLPRAVSGERAAAYPQASFVQQWRSRRERGPGAGRQAIKGGSSTIDETVVNAFKAFDEKLMDYLEKLRKCMP
jgi:hypothetical protein